MTKSVAPIAPDVLSYFLAVNLGERRSSIALLPMKGTFSFGQMSAVRDYLRAHYSDSPWLVTELGISLTVSAAFTSDQLDELVNRLTATVAGHRDYDLVRLSGPALLPVAFVPCAGVAVVNYQMAGIRLSRVEIETVSAALEHVPPAVSSIVRDAALYLRHGGMPLEDFATDTLKAALEVAMGELWRIMVTRKEPLKALLPVFVPAA